MDRMKNLGIVKREGSNLFMVFEEGRMRMFFNPQSKSKSPWTEGDLRSQLEHKVYCPIEFLE